MVTHIYLQVTSVHLHLHHQQITCVWALIGPCIYISVPLCLPQTFCSGWFYLWTHTGPVLLVFLPQKKTGSEGSSLLKIYTEEGGGGAPAGQEDLWDQWNHFHWISGSVPPVPKISQRSSDWLYTGRRGCRHRAHWLYWEDRTQMFPWRL